MAEMINFTNKSNYQDIIPTTAIPIKIMNIQSPYIMRAYEIDKYLEKIDKINRKLSKFTKSVSFCKRKQKYICPKIGDMVLVESSNYKNAVTELPSYLCRGLITYIKHRETTYNILLVDHGISVELSRQEFHVVSQDFISDNYLSKTLGVYNVLPVKIRKSITNKGNARTVVLEEWSEEAIWFVKNLLHASDVVYFNHLVTDEKNGREYGEFYFVMDNIIMLLTQALIISYYATYLEGDLLKLIESPSQEEKMAKENIIINSKFQVHKRRDCINSESIMNGINRCNITKNNEKVLIHSTTKCGVLTNVNELSFAKGIHKGWNGYIKSSRPRKIQSYIWPAIKKGLNVVAIGPSQSGKTTGCVMAVCGLVAIYQNEISYSATHPLALILCSSSFDVINIQSMCVTLLQSHENIKSVAAFNGKTTRSVAASIYSGCQILVATPQYLVRFLKENKDLVSFDKLCCLVFDNVDLILDKYYPSVVELFKKYNIIDNREPQGDNRPLLQMIISGTKWTSHIKKFVSLVMYNPYICITSFIEAVIFKSIHPKACIIKSIYKNQKILDILKEDYTVLRTMIVCINAEEAEELKRFLHPTKKTVLVHEKMKSSDIQTLQENWKVCIRGLYPVLICTDAVLSELNFTNIQWLIHHSVLLKWKNQFNYRFSVLLDSLIQHAASCRITIIIDENNNMQFQSIIKIMQRMKVVIPPELIENIERIATTLERDKKNYTICNNVKSFGFCSDQDVCVYRHCILPEIDMPMNDIKINDKLKLILMYVHDTTHFSARVIQHIPNSNNSPNVKFSNVEYMQITFKIQKYYQDIKNRKMCTSTNVGDVCVLEESIDTFKRVQIKRIRYDGEYAENIKFVDVRCIDSGVIHERIDIRRLMYIPEELLNLPTHTVEIFLTDLTPCDDEHVWNYCTNETVHKWFSQNVDQRSYIIGTVRLNLGNTIWLDDLEVGTKLIGHNDLIGCSLKKELIAKNHAVPNINHITYLLELCKKGGFKEVNGCDISILCE